MKYLVIDAALSGTGIRDKYEGGYIDPDDLGLSLATKIILRQYINQAGTNCLFFSQSRC